MKKVKMIWNQQWSRFCYSENNMRSVWGTHFQDFSPSVPPCHNFFLCISPLWLLTSCWAVDKNIFFMIMTSTTTVQVNPLMPTNRWWAGRHIFIKLSKWHNLSSRNMSNDCWIVIYPTVLEWLTCDEHLCQRQLHKSKLKTATIWICLSQQRFGKNKLERTSLWHMFHSRAIRYVKIRPSL